MVASTQSSLQFCGNKKRLRGIVVLGPQDIGFTADLAIFHISLASSGGFIDNRGIPFSARRALETRFHAAGSISQRRGVFLMQRRRVTFSPVYTEVGNSDSPIMAGRRH